jgi:tetratricopeptide (TPR) repeat protein
MFDIRAKIFLLRLQLLTLIIFSATASAQTSQEAKNMFTQAQSYYLFGEYELANPIYLTLAAFQPDNFNIIYKIGDCYLNITDEKAKAIEFLEKAVKNSSYDANPDQVKEKRAPLDSYFSLARAYMINNELEKALTTLQTFQKLAGETKQKGGMKNIEYIDQLILACKNAIKFQATPVKIDKVKLPASFSQGSVNDDPAVSFDGNTIAYTERRGISNAIYFSRRERGKWQPPIDITSDIKAGEDCSTCSMNSDGTELFLYKEDMKDGNLYSTNFVNGTWTPIKKLNNRINTKFYESHACVSADGKKLYFTSNREGGFGGLDIYVSEKDATGDWGEAKNLGVSINTPYNEDTPFITKNDSDLYFSSEGHTSIGGYDIFKSNRSGDIWKTPQNIGYPLNTTDDDKFFEPVFNGMYAYYSMPTDYKKREIFCIGVGRLAIDQVFEIKGILSLSDTTQKLDENYKIYLTDLNSRDTLSILLPYKDAGHYNFTVNPGKFRIMYTGTNYISQTIDTTLNQDNPSAVITIDLTLKKEAPPIVYEKIDLALIPTVKSIDTAILIKNMNVNDVTDANIKDSDVLYYTVQVMALHNPVDVSYFKYITNMKVMYNDLDKFYRYTTGVFVTREEASAWREELIKKGYPEGIFIKKVSKQ